jgi:hypothetical protein
VELLSPTKIQAEKRCGEQEARIRTTALAAEESALAKRLNQARSSAQKEIDRLNKSVEERNAEARVKKTILERQVDDLETRREAALRPIKKIEEETNRRLLEANERLLQVEDIRIELENERSRIKEQTRLLIKQSQSIEEREKKINYKEAGIIAGQNKLDESARDLGQRWTELNQAKAQFNREKEVMAVKALKTAEIERMNVIRQKELDNREKTLRSDRIALQDAYKALAAAKKEILGQ